MNPQFEYCRWRSECYLVSVGIRRRKSRNGLCQNCVTYPPKPWGNTVIYGDTPTHIDVAEVVESEGQVDYGEGPMVRHPQAGQYRRTRLFVLTLGY